MWGSDHLFFTTEGVWGIPAGVSATFIVMFIIFAAFLEQSKGGDFFIDFSMGLFGKARGGPAKAAIFASGFMGVLSGSAVANVVTTGTFTISLMQRLGTVPDLPGLWGQWLRQAASSRRRSWGRRPLSSPSSWVFLISRWLRRQHCLHFFTISAHLHGALCVPAHRPQGDECRMNFPMSVKP